MPTSKSFSTDWASIIAYDTDDLEHKDQVRKLIVEGLGFEPSLNASRSTERGLRKELKLLEQGKISQNTFNKRLHNGLILIKKYILIRVPEQAHLFDPKEAEAPFLDTRDE
ncbi:hypothetical protein KORDIASMS9_02818 [Kordia sp. SMS9]|uniref:hypothetical protein n=1 Tax=Kordia sp. SMS9 TaxID=2282170 RepID=UPI000E0DD95F|nr:hypothetical protein [Kordia sp. SMS9]AXG70578.1 hypothetical protein KORDIASMS9_02818 [Kordia sp. SMS9]